jgi:cobalamin biosynthesis protein CbiG
MRVKVEKVGRGSHPSEVMVSVRTVEGEERLVVHKRSLQEDSTLEIGYPINQENRNYLVELPRETLRGEWRVWVPDTMVSG